MRRTQPQIEPPDVKKRSNEKERKVGGTKVVVQKRRYKLITPLYGGGVKPNEADPVTTIRSTEIRGQLRFWWRAIRGWQSGGDPRKLKDLEDKIWGAASKTEKEKHEQDEEKGWKEAVQVVVEEVEKGKIVKPFTPFINEDGKPRVRPNKDVSDYASFPLRPSEDKLKKDGEKTFVADLRKEVAFTLRISFSEKCSEEVLAALWAWETFGGIGARTRRGFGVLQLVKIDDEDYTDFPPTDPIEARRWIEHKLKHWIRGSEYPENVPHLTVEPQLRMAGSASNPTNSWREVIRIFRDFRQKRFPSRKKKYGRSMWPEADAIRKLTRAAEFRKSLGLPDKLPRAALGLPIVFHFIDRPKGDPPDMTLQGPEKNRDRLASPLILRPLICQNGQALGLVLRLEGVQLPKKLVLEGKEWEGIPPLDKSKAQLTPQEVKKLPMLGDQTDVVQAFLNFFEEEI